MTEANSTIDADEARLYDRQIRLWGVEAQNRMKNSKVLLVGLRGLHTEVCKNIVLSGIRTAYLLDPNPVAISDLSAGFFFTAEDVGKNRGEAGAGRIGELNPRVEILVDKDRIEDKPDDFFKQFQVICLSDCTLQVMQQVDRVARQHAIPLFAGFLLGWHGVVYMDHHQHTYKDVKKDAEGQETTSIRTSEMPSWQEVFQLPWDGRAFRRMNSKLSLAHQILLQYQASGPNSASEEDFRSFAKSHLETSRKVADDFVSAEDLGEVYRLQGKDLSPVAAVVGGIVAQEVIKILSGKDEPLGNCFLFDGKQSRGIIECFAPEAPVQVKKPTTTTTVVDDVIEL